MNMRNDLGRTRVGEWQPIETAPKDGTRILLADFDEMPLPVIVVADWHDGRQWNPDHRIAYAKGWRVMWDFDLFEEGFTATHWMPLPEPPSLSPTPESQS